VRVGKAAWVAGATPLGEAAVRTRDAARRAGSSAPFVSVDGELAAALLLEDRLRPEGAATVRRLREIGWRRIVLLTGDQREPAEAVGREAGVDEVLCEQTPAAKMAAVLAARATGVVAMVGDGINDAPALATADVGIAMGARGATASSQAADVVIVPDRLDCLIDACLIARRSRRIALQSIGVGMALSILGMLLASVGWLTPVAGAVAQEAIDLVVILNALRALGAPHGVPASLAR